MRPTVLAAALAAAAAACAPYAPSSGAGPQASAAGRCFQPDDVLAFREAGPRTVDLTVRGGTMYRLETLGACRDLGSSVNMAVETTGGARVICGPADASLIVPTLSGPRRCPVRTLRMLTPTEAQASAAR